jgi:hypothetical protein
VLAAWPAGVLAGQVSLHLGFGGRYSANLWRDSIVSPVELRPKMAPVLTVTARYPLAPRLSADITLDLAPSGLRRREQDTWYDAGGFTTVAFTVGLQRRITGILSARAGFGALRYVAEKGGVFRQGTGGLFPLGTAGVVIAPRFGARRRLEIEARYDVHRFHTPALRAEGFTGSRPVHRVALLARIGRGTRPIQ